MKPSTLVLSFLSLFSASTASPLAKRASGSKQTATSILVPLYLYPTASNWNPVFDTIKAYPQIQFQVVVNPNSGPGTFPPDKAYIDNVAKLNKFSNALTIGYVRTTYGARALAEVQADIDVYAKWASYTASNISVAGIFFDEAPNKASNLNYLNTAGTYARSHIKSKSPAFRIFNPGAPAAIELFAAADLIVTHESFYSSSAGWKNDVVGSPAQQAFIGINTPKNTALTAVQNWASTPLGAVYVTADCADPAKGPCYQDFSLLPTLAQTVAKYSPARGSK